MFIVLEMEPNDKDIAWKPWFCAHKNHGWNLGWLNLAIRYSPKSYKDIATKEWDWQ